MTHERKTFTVIDLPGPFEGFLKLSAVGLLVDENGSVYEKVAEIIGETEFDKRKKEWEKPEKQKMYDDAVKTIQGKLKNMALSSMPVRSKIN